MNKNPESPAHSSANHPASDQASNPAGNPNWEEQINALLDGELDNEQAEQLKTAAGQDRALAQAIVDAYQLQQALEAIPLQRAPASLRRKLASIPAEQGKKSHPAFWPKSWVSSWPVSRSGWFRPAWITALAAIPLAVIVLNLWQAAPVEQTVPATAGVTEPTAAELQEAQRELAVVFAYLGKIGRKTSLEIGQTVNSEMQQNINENMIRTLREQMEFNKERNA